MTLWLGTVPSALSLAILLVAWNLIAVAMMLAVRWWSLRAGIASGPPVVNSWATCAGALAALLFAFTIVTLWNQDTRAGANLDAEAAAIRTIARDLAPKELPLLRAYVLQTIAEWPGLCGGSGSGGAADALDTLERTAQPSSEKYADNLYNTLGTLEDMHNARWLIASASVPDEIWTALTVLALVLLLVLCVAMPDRFGTHLALMIAVGTALGTLFWVTIVLEYPFCGTTAISPSDIVSILRTHLL